MRKIILLGALALLCTVLVAGAQAGRQATVVKLKFATFVWQPTTIKANKAIVDAWNRNHPGIQVEIVEVDPNSVHDKLLTSFVGGTAADVIHDEAADIAGFTQQGYLANLTPLELDFENEGRNAETVARNAGQALVLHKTRRASDLTARNLALEEIQEALGLDEVPLRIECYDVSNLQGTEVVASMVVFEDGLPRKSEYRRFAITGATDDVSAISEVLRNDTAGRRA